MKSDNDNSWLDPLLSQQVQHEPAEFDFARWSQEHPQEAYLLEHGFSDTHRSQRTSTYLIWRCIMESKVTKYSAAAAVAFALVLVLLNPFGGVEKDRLKIIAFFKAQLRDCQKEIRLASICLCLQMRKEEEWIIHREFPL